MYASFTVPSVNCTATGAVSHWVGLDGAGYNLAASTSLEAEGVTAQCANGTASYYAWWETYPQPQTDALSVAPGDAISADIIYTPGAQDPYLFSLGDETTGKGWELSEPCGATSCLNSSAEVISSAPSDAASTQAGDIAPLADYGQASFVGIGLEDHSAQFGGLTSSNWIQHEVYTPPMANSVINNYSDSLYGGAAFFNVWPSLVSP